MMSLDEMDEVARGLGEIAQRSSHILLGRAALVADGRVEEVDARIEGSLHDSARGVLADGP